MNITIFAYYLRAPKVTSKCGIIRNSDPIQVNRLFDSHCVLQISEFPKDSLMSSCPDFDLGYNMAPLG
jgi:hypothetical protein